MAFLVSHGYVLQTGKKLLHMGLHTHGVRYRVQAVGAVCMHACCSKSSATWLKQNIFKLYFLADKYFNFGFFLLRETFFFFNFIFQQEGKSSLNTAKYNKHLQMGWSAAGGFNFVVFIWNIKASRARLKHSGHNSQCFGSWANSSWT